MEITIANGRSWTEAQTLVKALEGQTYMNFTVRGVPDPESSKGFFNVIVGTERGDVTKEQMTDMMIQVLSFHMVGLADALRALNALS